MAKTLLSDIDGVSPPDTIVKGLPAVAVHFGKSLRQVQRWVKDHSFPRLSGKRFDLLQIQAWLDQKDGRPPLRSYQPAASGQADLPREDGGKDYWDKKAKEFQAKTRELEYRQRLAELVERTEIEQMHVARIMAVKQGLLNLERSLPPLLIHCQAEREMAAVIHRAVHELLDEFSRPLPIPGGQQG